MIKNENIFNEKWLSWEPIPGLARCYEIDRVSDMAGEMSIVLSQARNHDIKIRITFTDLIEAYRSTYETFRIKISCHYQGGTFFIVENSEYIKWLSDQSPTGDIDHDNKLIHFAIATDDRVVDIIAKHEPKIEFIKK